MMRLKVGIISLLLVAGASFSVFAWWNKSFLVPTYSANSLQGNDYEDQWKRIDSLDQKRLPESARDAVKTIYAQARSEKNHPQQLKAAIYLLRYQQELEEDEFKVSFYDLKVMAAEAESPHKEVIYSVLAELYWTYYRQNRYAFYDRSITRDFDPEDIRTWDLEKIIRQATLYYLRSLDNREITQATAVETYLPLLEVHSETRNLRPALFDFLAHRAIDFFKNTEIDLTRPATAFIPDKPEYFSESDRFIKLQVPFTDSFSRHFYVLNIFQELERFHSSGSQKAALIDVQIKRLEYVLAETPLPARDTLYYAALRQITQRYEDNPEVAQAWYKIANVHYTLGQRYDPLLSVNANNTTENTADLFKWEFKKALEICRQTIAKYPGSFGASQCEVLQQKILLPLLSLNTEEVVSANKPSNVLLVSQNVGKIHFRLVNLGWEYRGIRFFVKWSDQLADYLRQPVVREWTQDLQDDGDLQQHSLEMPLPALKPGYYILLAGTSPEFSTEGQAVVWTGFGVSDIALTLRSLNGGQIQYNVLHRETGEPLSNALVNVYSRNYNNANGQNELQFEKTLHTDRNGQFTIFPDKATKNFYFDILKGKDRLNTAQSHYLSSFNTVEEEQKPYYSTHFFLDRGIYRPGQTLHFKGIHLYHTPGESEKVRIAPGRKLTVDFIDVNEDEVASQDVVTNEYGTFSGTFTVPSSGLTGQMYIEDEFSEEYFLVEEYKRPRFEVNFQPVKGTYKLGEKITVKGQAQAYAGSQIDGAKVSFRVTRNVYYPFYYRSFLPVHQSVTEITRGELTTDENGFFEITFVASPDLAANRRDNPAFLFSVSADVTDLNGETRSASSSVSVGYQAMQLGIDLPSLLSTSHKKGIFVYSYNLNGEPVPAKGMVKIYRLRQPAAVYRERVLEQPDRHTLDEKTYRRQFPHDTYANETDPENWPHEQLVFEAGFNTEKGDSLRLNKLASWKPGKYVILATALDSFGTTVTEKKFFTVFAENSKVMPERVPLLVIPLHTTVEPGEKARLLLGTALKKVNVLYEIEQEGKITEKKWLKLSNTLQKIEIPVEEKHRGNFTVHFTFVRHDRLYKHSEDIQVPYTNKEIDIAFETFRDKLIPGQQEEWKLKLKGKKGEKLAAEMLLTMYDASLDAFAPNMLIFDPYTHSYGNLFWQKGYGFGVKYSQLMGDNWRKEPYHSYRFYEGLNWFGYEPYTFFSLYPMRARYRMTEEEGPNVQDFMEMAVVSAPGSGAVGNKVREKIPLLDKDGDALEVLPGVEALSHAYTVSSANTAPNPATVKARSNFNETAFFYPHLQTDAEGNIVVKFTVPESLTRWKLQGIAHTRDLKIGHIRKELVTRKELMVMPNLPRFFREGDKLVLVSKISNLSETDLEGQAKLLLFDALTQQPIDTRFALQQASLSFSAKKGQSVSVSWTISVPSGIEAVTCRVVATAGNFSDGEETVIPVLTNRTLVTESLPLPVRKKGTHTFTLRSLTDSKKSSTLSPHRLTLEFTSNPAWYAVQALPYMMEYPYECAEQVFSRFYANAIAAHLVNSSPRIKRVFDSWKNSSPEAFLSKLEKNQELKSLILEETPWVLDARDEGERKRRVALLFDLNHMQNELGRALQKLQQMQLANGAWAWFSGMTENRTITQHIVAGMGHLDRLGVKIVREDETLKEILRKAMQYLDRQLVEEYQQLVKKAEKDKRDFRKENHLGQLQVHYLYARSFFNDLTPGHDKLGEALAFYREQASRYWTSLDLYAQGMLALAAHRSELKALSADIVKSIRQRALRSEEMGMYWKQNVAGYGWYQSPVETQALLIEMFDEVADDQATVEALKVWLLKNKQTSDWKTTKATAEAVYALLLRGTNLLETEETVEVKLAGQLIDPKQKGAAVEAGTGYYKVAWHASEIRPEMGNVSVTKTTDGVAWGALYWQYFEQLDKIKSAETGLKLNKKLFVVKNTDRGPVITPVETTTLAPGDKIRVRMELRTDRNLEYVHLKDMRASGFEPVNVLSGYKYRNGLGYYESTRDASTNFFFDYIPKGTYVFEYDLFVAQSGDFSNGITTIQCMYAPEFTSHSEGTRVTVK